MARDLTARATAAPNQQQTGKELSLPQKIDRMQREFEMAQPKGMEAVQLIRDAQTCIRMTPKLAECDHASVLGSLMTCAQLGLRPGVLGQAYLLPLWNGRNRRMEAQLILGYQGLLELVHRSDRITMIAARRVYENDEFRLDYGLEEDTLIHRPPVEGPRGRVVKWYAIARFKGGGYAITDPMTRQEMEEHRDRYAMAKKKDGTIVGPWVTQFEEMADKTILRQLVKTLPKSPELVRAITHDGAVRQDYSAAGIDAKPDYIDSTAVDVTSQDSSTEDTDSPYPQDDAQGGDDPYADVPPPTDEPAAGGGGSAAAPAKAPTKTKLTQLDKLFVEHGYAASDGSREEWLSNLFGDKIASVRDLSATEVDEAIAVLSGDQK